MEGMGPMMYKSENKKKDNDLSSAQILILDRQERSHCSIRSSIFKCIMVTPMHIIAFLICILPFATPYALPGAYERVFYYYAYLADVQIHGHATTIATGWHCGSNRDFNHCVHWINEFDLKTNFEGEKGKVPPVPVILSDVEENKRPDPDSAAKRLEQLSEMGTFEINSKTFEWKKVVLTGHYKTERIVGSARTLDTLITQVAGFLGGNRDKISVENLAALNRLVQRIHFHRVVASSEKAAEHLEDKNGKVVRYKNKILFDRGSRQPGTTFQVIDIHATEQANGGKKSIQLRKVV
jgi:hypothetical protein